ncbi:MAG: hypothetical protein M9893_13290, partial [Pyrinomonadaceae bacterium]|nr:hypothetical protein [Pyrinomonadaceae bacterium]
GDILILWEVAALTRHFCERKIENGTFLCGTDECVFATNLITERNFHIAGSKFYCRYIWINDQIF